MGIIINVALPLLQPSTGVERFMGRETRRENFALNSAWEESKVFWQGFSSKRIVGLRRNSPLGVAAVSTDRILPSVVPSTNTASYRQHVHANMHSLANLQAAHMRTRENQAAVLNILHFVTFAWEKCYTNKMYLLIYTWQNIVNLSTF